MYWIIAVGLLGLFIFGLPKILTWVGLHPHIKTKYFNVKGKKALIVTTSHGTLGQGGKATGVYASEMTIPYYEFLDNGMHVTVASMRGGKIPIDPISLKWPVRSDADKRFLQDPEFLGLVEDAPPISDVDFKDYDVVFFAGGWGAAYDMGYSEELGFKVSEAHGQGAVLGSVCHGCLGLIQAKDQNGNPLLQGRKITGVTNKQIKELGITATPQHPETEIRNLDAIYEYKSGLLDVLQTHVVVDGSIVTGQNQNSGQETAYQIMSILQSNTPQQA